MRIGLEHAADVLEQLAASGAQGDGQGDRRQVGPAAPERRQLAVGADALEAGHHRHQALRQRRAQRARQHAANLRSEVRGRGPDAGLGAGERARRDAARLEPEREERGRERLAGGKRPIGLARHPRLGVLRRRPQPVAAVGQQDARRTPGSCR